MKRGHKAILFRLINGFYVMIKVSALFWLVMLKYGLVYGFYPATVTCYMFYRSKYPEDESILKWLKRKFQIDLLAALLSLFFIFFGAISLTSWLEVSYNDSKIVLLCLVISTVAELFIILYTTTLQMIDDEKNRALYAYRAFQALITEWNRTGILLIILIVATWLGLTRHLFLYFIFPGFYHCILLLLEKQKREKRL